MWSTILLIGVGSLVAAVLNPIAADRRAVLATSLTNAREVKFALDTFAMDNDGVYPDDDTAQFYEIPLGDRRSNNYFLQLIAAGVVNKERLFWVKGAQVCNAEAPDDIIGQGGMLKLGECLQAGDCGWAYVRAQVNTDQPRRPQLLDAFLPGTTKFDRKLWDGKVITLFIDGSVQTLPLTPDGRILEQGENLLDPKAAIWKGAGVDPAKLLAQPIPTADPRKKAVAEPEEPAGKEE